MLEDQLVLEERNLYSRQNDAMLKEIKKIGKDVKSVKTDLQRMQADQKNVERKQQNFQLRLLDQLNQNPGRNKYREEVQRDREARGQQRNIARGGKGELGVS